MAYRFTNTEKWSDAWFSNLTQIQMLLFLYLCDNCDIAGFIETNTKRWSVDLGSSKETIEGALKGLQRGLMFSESGDCIYIRNFLKHQKNIPLNEKNMAHVGIIKRFSLYANKFNILNIHEFIEGASKGLQSPIGIGNGINGNSIIKKTPEKFYEEQLELSQNDKTYKIFIDWLFGNNILKRPLDNVLKMEEQISWDQFGSLLEIHKETGVRIRDLLIDLENWLMKNKKAKNSTVLGTLRTFAKNAKSEK